MKRVKVKKHQRKKPKNPGFTTVRDHTRLIKNSGVSILKTHKRSIHPYIVRRKKLFLKALDYRRDIDPKIRTAVRVLNEFPETFTTGSCEGHPGLHPDFEKPYIMGISAVGEDLNTFVEAASKSGLKLRIEPHYYRGVGYGRPEDIRQWYLSTRESDNWEESHKKLKKFRELLHPK